MRNGLMMGEIIGCRSDAIRATGDGVRLPDRKARFVKISHFNVENSESYEYKNPPSQNLADEVSSSEIYYGFDFPAHQLFIGETTEIFPVAENLNEIVVKARPGQTTTVWFSYWW